MNTNEKAPVAATTEASANSTRNHASTTRTPIVAQTAAERNENLVVVERNGGFFADSWNVAERVGSAGQIILPLLRSGQGGARKKPELLEATGLSDRVFRRGVESLRRAGVVVCSGDTGYYLPATLDEVQGYIRQEEHRARSTFFSLQSARALASRMQEQGEQTQISL